MNIYAVIILCTIVIEFAIHLIADLLNMKTLNAGLPAEFSGVYDEEKYRKSQQYTAVNTKFGILSSGFSLVITIAFWFGGGFPYLDGIVRSWNFGSPWTGMIYIGILVLARSILSLPFSIYSTFVIEERFGFNKTTAATFIAD